MTKTIVRHNRGRPPKSRRFLLKKAFEKTSFAPGKGLEKPSFALEKDLYKGFNIAQNHPIQGDKEVN